ncbi:NAD(P)/FAD-dependent oxidoreductase [Christiangramia aquimixticola]|uniref:NAD(P)/FAD-dependent oxidoreductase n=1 Tax=Christiangramia aquimixticola TaxID=1697558 RepID=UPI003AA9CB5F
MNKQNIAIVGGGLAGLVAAIHLCKAGVQVILFEKNSYPNHKVCGEYLSNEILPYLDFLGVELPSSSPKIEKLSYSTHSGEKIECPLEMGGVGVSRYTLDELLYKRALELGCEVKMETVTTIKFSTNRFLISTSKGNYQSDYVLGAYGKRSNLDKYLNREFIQKNSGWLGVKNHYLNADFHNDMVSLHNFEGGYCGLSRTDLNTINVCYLTTYNSFKRYRDTTEFKEKVLMQNPHLKRFFSNSRQVFERDISIAQISFGKRSLVKNHILMLGDSAGLIHPLSGNGMAMAIHSAKMAAESLLKFSISKENRELIENEYISVWNKNFNSRMWTGSMIQRILMNPGLATVSQKLLQLSPGVLKNLIRFTHGKKVYA